MQLINACLITVLCAAVGAYTMAVDQSLLASPVTSQLQDTAPTTSLPPSSTSASSSPTSPESKSSAASIISTFPVVVTTTTTTTFHTTTARESRTLYLTHYSSRDRSLNNTDCDATSGSSSHTVTAVQTNRCQLFPGMAFNSTDGFYAIYSTDQDSLFYIATGCDHACMGCRLLYTQTLGVCATSLLHPHNESWLLTRSTCEGGLRRTISDLSDNELSIVHYPSSTTCQFNYNGQETVTNLGPADRRCLDVEGIHAMVQSTGNRMYTLWWGCDMHCQNCKFIRANITFDTCLSTSLTGLPGTLNIMPTRRLASCAPEEERGGLSVGAIVAIVVVSVLAMAGLITLGIWLYRRSRRAHYQRIHN